MVAYSGINATTLMVQHWHECSEKVVNQVLNSQQEILSVSNSIDNPEDYLHCFEPLLSELKQLEQQLSARRVNNKSDVSPRQLQRLVNNEYGVSPHKLASIRRFQKAARNLFVDTKPLSEQAIESGYSDQSHMTRELKRYSGLTPKEFQNSWCYSDGSSVRFVSRPLVSSCLF